MQRRQLLRFAVAAGGALAAPHALRAQADPLAGLAPAQRALVESYLARQTQGGQGAAQPDLLLRLDLDGDGRPELALLWTFLGPTFGWSKVTVFGERGGRWVERGSVDVQGQAQGMTAQGSELRIATLVPGPGDPRCCPSRRHLQRIRWAGGRLQSAKP